MKNLFWSIYNQIEKEFKELSYFIYIDRKQLKTYSVKIAELILRVVSECENISSEICKIEKIKFKDKKGHIRKSVYFNEYVDRLNDIFNLEDKLVNPIYENIDQNAFYSKLIPFRKEKRRVDGKEKEILSWYYSYNKIKHDRVKNYKEANLENLINGLAALFLLNIYYNNKVFYSKDNYNLDLIINNIESFSDVFEVDYAIKLENIDKIDEKAKEKDSFFSPKSFWEVSMPMSTYIIEYDKTYKTSSDAGADIMDKLESSVLILQEDGTVTKKYQDYKLTDHKSICAIVASINRIG